MPSASRRWFHAWQHLYLWFFYALSVVKWQLVDDFLNVARGKLGRHRIPRPRGGDLAVFLAGNMLLFFFAFGLPPAFHPLPRAMAIYLED